MLPFLGSDDLVRARQCAIIGCALGRAQLSGAHQVVRNILVRT
jgi:hypothetical protein